MTKKLLYEDVEVISTVKEQRVVRSELVEPDLIEIDTACTIGRFTSYCSVRITAEEFQAIYDALSGVCRGVLSKEHLNYRQAKEQIYAKLRESLPTLHAIATDTEFGEQWFMHSTESEDQLQEALALLRCLAGIVAVELKDRAVELDEPT